MIVTRLPFRIRVLHLGAALLSLFIAESVVRAQCNATNLCPQQTPCCSQYGFCGSGAYCIGGCDPLGSFSLDSCVANPVCQSGNYTFGNESALSTIYYPDTSGPWLGDVASNPNAAFILNGGNVSFNPDTQALQLLLTEDNGGTRLSFARYVWYGKITARIKPAYEPGVVSAFITISDVKDEIDWEEPGQGGGQGQWQSNFYYEGITGTTTNVGYHNVNDVEDEHDFTIDWNETSITWLIDGVPVRTVDKNGVEFPSTPSQIELSLWNGGSPTTAPGTVKWAGGPTNFNTSTNGTFIMEVAWVSVECYGGTPNGTSYSYAGTVEDLQVVIGDRSTVVNITNTSSTTPPSGPINGTNPGEAATTSGTSSSTSDAGILVVDSKILSSVVIGIVAAVLLLEA